MGGHNSSVIKIGSKNEFNATVKRRPQTSTRTKTWLDQNIRMNKNVSVNFITVDS